MEGEELYRVQWDELKRLLAEYTHQLSFEHLGYFFKTAYDDLSHKVGIFDRLRLGEKPSKEELFKVKAALQLELHEDIASVVGYIARVENEIGNLANEMLTFIYKEENKQNFAIGNE